NGHSDLVDGALVPHGFAASASSRGRRGLLEFWRAVGSGRNSRGRQHWLPMARVSTLCRRCLVHRLFAHHFLGGAHVPLPARRSDLYHAMVFDRRVSLVPLALRGCEFDALCRAGPRRPPSRCELVVCEQSSLSLVWRDWTRDR